jgi:hypothetical protein
MLPSFREWIRGFHDLLRQRPSSLFIFLRWGLISVASLLMWSMYLNLMETMLVSWVRSDYPGCCCVWLGLVYLNGPGECTDGAPWPLSQWNGWSAHVDLTTFTGHAVNAWSILSKVILQRLKEAGTLPQWVTHRLGVVSGQHSANAHEHCADKEKMSDRWVLPGQWQLMDWKPFISTDCYSCSVWKWPG